MMRCGAGRKVAAKAPQRNEADEEANAGDAHVGDRVVVEGNARFEHGVVGIDWVVVNSYLATVLFSEQLLLRFITDKGPVYIVVWARIAAPVYLILIPAHKLLAAGAEPLTRKCLGRSAGLLAPRTWPSGGLQATYNANSQALKSEA